jgi:mevalonate kinase
LTAVYSGAKVATPEVIARVERRRAAQPALFDALFDAIDACTGAAARAAEAGDWAEFGALLDAGHGLMVALGVCTPRLAALVAALQGADPRGRDAAAQPADARDASRTSTAHAATRGAKISGAGLGDCVIALGPADAAATARLAAIDAVPIAVDIAPHGVQVHVRSAA